MNCTIRRIQGLFRGVKVNNASHPKQSASLPFSTAPFGLRPGRIPKVVLSFLVFVVTLSVVLHFLNGDAALAQGQGDTESVSYITVSVSTTRSGSDPVVTNFTVRWVDSGDCTTNYNAYLKIKPGNRPGHETEGS